MTAPEILIWSKLRMKQIYGYQFYRQKPIGEYIVDFYSPGAKLVIEIDGESHYQGREPNSDAEKDTYLTDQGLMVLRFTNTQIMENIDGVIEKILAELS